MVKKFVVVSALSLCLLSGTSDVLAEDAPPNEPRAYNRGNVKTTVLDGSEITQDQPTLPGETGRKVIGHITFTFAEMDAEHPSRQVTSNVVENKSITDEECLEAYIQDIYRIGQKGDVLHIDAVNGVPIAQTKFAQYGGEIAVTLPYLGGRNPLGLPIKDRGGNVLYDGFFVKTDKMIGAEAFNKARAEAGYAITMKDPREVTVVINNEPVEFPDEKPFILPEIEIAMVPMRALFEHVGVQCTVEWNEQEQTITAQSRNGRIVIFTIGKKTMTIIHKDGKQEQVENEINPLILKGHTFLPLRALSEALSLKVEWSDSTYEVSIQGSDEFNKSLMTNEKWKEFVKEYNG